MQELVRGYHLDKGTSRCAIKLYIMKAYDSVDWGFLLDVIRYMDFPDQYIHWIKLCITSPFFSLLSLMGN